MNPVDSLKAVLCGQDGKCCIAGSEADRKVVDEALAALDTAQPVQVNAMLVGLLEPAFTEIQHVLGSTLELPFQRKSLETALELLRTALTAAKQAQPERALTDKEQIAKNKRDLLQQMQAQPERAPLSDEQKRILFECAERVKDGNELDYWLLGFEAAERIHGIKQGGQQ